jgi:hypothetical protein
MGPVLCGGFSVVTSSVGLSVRLRWCLSVVAYGMHGLNDHKWIFMSRTSYVVQLNLNFFVNELFQINLLASILRYPVFAFPTFE